MLERQNLSKHFGGVRAVDSLSLRIEPGQIFGLIGPNGSGKSTTVNLIAGLLQATHGNIRLAGTDVTTLPTHARLSNGIARTFQNIRLFGQLTVWQNLWVAENSKAQRERMGFMSRWLGGERGARRHRRRLRAAPHRLEHDVGGPPAGGADRPVPEDASARPVRGHRPGRRGR